MPLINLYLCAYMYLCGHFNLLDISDIWRQIDWLGNKPNANLSRNTASLLGKVEIKQQRSKL